MALAALSGAAVLDVGATTAEAAPSVSRFAGTFRFTSPWTPGGVTISDAGRITGSWDSHESISGRVGDDGSYSFSWTEINFFDDEGAPRGGRKRSRFTYTMAGTLALDAAGNIVGTVDDGGSFVWLRQ